ncbi:MAG: ABC transporter permease [Pseudomonadota bacterium]
MREVAALAGLLRAAGLVVGITLLIFLFVRVVPGDVVDLVGIEGGLTDAMKEEMRQELGLNQSLGQQFVLWVGQLAQGDFGLSIRYHRPVADLIARALPTTLQLAALSFTIGLVLGVGAAVAAVTWPRSVWPSVVQALNVWSIAVPTFCAGLLLIFVFVLWLGWMPLLGNLWLASIILGVDVAGQLTKPLHEDLKETLNATFVKTARAKGIRPILVIWRHVLPNSLSVLLSLSGLVLAGLVGGTITMELLFGLPGLGKLALDSVLGRDYPAIQAVAVILAVSVVMVNALVDLLARLIDPRLS